MGLSNGLWFFLHLPRVENSYLSLYTSIKLWDMVVEIGSLYVMHVLCILATRPRQWITITITKSRIIAQRATMAVDEPYITECSAPPAPQRGDVFATWDDCLRRSITRSRLASCPLRPPAQTLTVIRRKGKPQGFMQVDSRNTQALAWNAYGYDWELREPPSLGSRAYILLLGSSHAKGQVSRTGNFMSQSS